MVARVTYTVTVRGDTNARIVVEFVCEECGPFEIMAPRSEVSRREECPGCGFRCDALVSAPMGRSSLTSVTTTSGGERPPWALDTRSIADGEPTGKWRARTNAKILAERRDRFRKEVL